MKPLFLITSILIYAFFLSCDNNEVSSEQKLIDSLIGKWEEISPCMSCSMVTFKDDNTIELKFNFDSEIYNISYSVDGEFLTLIRHWDVGGNKESNRVKVLFDSKDTLQLLQFKATDVTSATGFEDIQLKRYKS